MAQARSLTLLINQRGKLLTLSVMSQFIVFLDKRIFLRVHTHSVVLSLVATNIRSSGRQVVHSVFRACKSWARLIEREK